MQCPSISRRAALAVLAGGLVARTAVAQTAPAPVALVVRGGKLVSGPRVIQLKRGDAVVLSVDADRPDELHLHGYNLHADVQPGRPGTLKFVAQRTGRFALELHKAGTEVSVLEIYPR
jgi:hypothetical protein